MLPMLFLWMPGCALFEGAQDLGDLFNDLTNPVIVQSIVLGVQEPQDEALADILAASELEMGTTATVFVGDATDSGGANQGAVSGAAVSLQGVSAKEESPGLYSIDPTGGLTYAVGATWTVQVSVPGAEGASLLPVELPPAAPLEIPTQHDVDEALTLDFTGMSYDSALVFVLNAKGVVTWTNQPETAEDVLHFGDGDSTLRTLEIPGSAFSEPSLYVLGVAGMRKGSDDAAENVNTLLSGVSAGQMQLFPLWTTAPLVTQARLVDVVSPEPALEAMLAAADVQVGVSASVFMADALAGAVTLEGAALPGGTVQVLGDIDAMASDEGAGWYGLDPGAGLSWEVGATWAVDVAVDDLAGSLSVVLPEAPVVALADEITAGEDLSVDLTGLDFDSALVVVIDGSGQVVFSNEPASPEELVDLVQDPPALGELIVPGSALSSAGIYAVGITGFYHGDSADFTGVNAPLSSMLAGRTSFYAVSAVP